jgi:hypothetical protein
VLGPYYVTNDARRREAWGPPCPSIATQGRVKIDGRTFALHRNAVPAFDAWEVVRKVHDYKLTGTDTGFYNCRHIQHDESKPMSYHSWGMAMDVNWLSNPAGSKLVTDIPQEMIDDLLAIRTNSGARVFRWGGDWDWDGDWRDHSYVDAMHWEVVAHPKDLVTGIDIETVRGMSVFTDEEVHELKAYVAAVKEVGSNMGYVPYLIEDIRKNIITKDELDAALAAAEAGSADAARKVADKALARAEYANRRLDALKVALQ